MTNNKKLIDTTIAINTIFNNKDLAFKDQLQLALLEVVKCLQVDSGSIMHKKSPKKLMVTASTDEGLIGAEQFLNEESPSTWVVKNKASLYVENIDKSNTLLKKHDHYKGHSFLLVPIICNKKVISIICVTDKIGKDVFSKEEQEALLNMTGLFISAHENQRLLDSVKKQKRTLNKKNLQLQKLEKLKVDLFNMLIHDLKGPLSEMIANLDILSYTASKKNQEYVEAAKVGCDTLYSMTCNLLDIARLEEGKFELIYEKIDPKQLIKESLARLFSLFEIKELTFVEKIPAIRTMDLFWGDRGILLRVLQNLLANAINYSPAGGAIEVGFEYLKPSKIQFFVKDKGPGVPPESHEAIFDKYFQLKKKGDGRIYTTGLGLTFCKMAVNAHRGKIGVKSGRLGGSCFFFNLPIEKKARFK